MNLEEFESSLVFLEDKKIEMALKDMGIDMNNSFGIIIGFGMMLIVFFVFILVGVSAFSIGGSFGSVVNSLLPVVSGSALTKPQALQFTKKTKEELKEIIDKIKHIL
mmetsp:Transcript_10945/g.1701  ORF Transcript_10945/g.1701 Transcript_10945/m.1701 type:complete len:107 (-) Transcript_10945:51-371(-)